MPFTFAHPLYAAPLKLLNPKYISLTGIILGSMSPDFEYFIALEPFQSIGHSVQGLFLQAIPLSILFAFVFHQWIKIPLTRNLPSCCNLDARVQGIVQDWKLDTLRKWIIFIVSVIIGFYSHVLIDAFTHQSGWFVTRYAFFQQQLMGIPLYKLLQHSLSVVGLIVEATFVLMLLNNSKQSSAIRRVENKEKVVFWAVVLLVAILLILLKLVISSSTNYIGIIVVAPISGFFLGLVLSSLVYRIF